MPEVHLGDVGDQRRLGAAGLAGDVGEAGKELVVGERLERSVQCHATKVRPTLDRIGPRLTY
jgi:hypothetical protein